MSASARRFYERRAAPGGWATPASGRLEEAGLGAFVAQHRLEHARVLELGCGTGEFQTLTSRWFGTDLALSAGRLISKPFVVASGQALPFRDESFDAAWSIAVLEHVPDPEAALGELARVLRPNGVVYLAPAWHCRPWAAEGLHVRPWGDLSWRQRLVKASIPLRNALWFRAACALPVRAVRELAYRLHPRRSLPLRYGRITPNYDHFWAADSDACSVLDPHEMLLWFLSRGWKSMSHPGWRRLSVRHGAIVVGKP